jgi:hypothetical protein
MMIKTFVSRAALVLILLALTGVDCNSAPEPVRNRVTGSAGEDGPTPPEIRCAAAQGKDGRPIVRFKVRNVGTETIHILAGRGMPYELARDSNMLVILQGVNKPEPGVIYELQPIPPTRPLAPGAGLAWDVPVGEKMLPDHYLLRPAPASLLHGMIHVRCEVGWGAIPTRPGQMSLDELFAWQRIESYGPFDLVLP